MRIDFFFNNNVNFRIGWKLYAINVSNASTLGSILSAVCGGVAGVSLTFSHFVLFLTFADPQVLNKSLFIVLAGSHGKYNLESFFGVSSEYQTDCVRSGPPLC